MVCFDLRKRQELLLKDLQKKRTQYVSQLGGRFLPRIKGLEEFLYKRGSKVTPVKSTRSKLKI
jgi:hypothetical protein